MAGMLLGSECVDSDKFISLFSEKKWFAKTSDLRLACFVSSRLTRQSKHKTKSLEGFFGMTARWRFPPKVYACRDRTLSGNWPQNVAPACQQTG